MLRELILTQRCSTVNFGNTTNSWYKLPDAINKTMERWPEAGETHSYGLISNLPKHSRNLQSLSTASVWKEFAALCQGFCWVWFGWLWKLVWTGKACKPGHCWEEWKKGKRWEKNSSLKISRCSYFHRKELNTNSKHFTKQ